MIKVEIEDRQVVQALQRLAAATSNQKMVLDDIGELLIASTKRRFSTSTGPDGQRWAPNSQVTILQYLRGRSGVFASNGKRTGDKKGYFYKKGADKGRLAEKGISTVIGKRPLIDGGDLARQIIKTVHGNTLLVGSTMIYSAVQQFGLKQGKSGSTKRGSPIPWGDIPARPFLGISDQDRVDILDAISDYLGNSFRP
jgi:phage gpG-like protein